MGSPGITMRNQSWLSGIARAACRRAAAVFGSAVGCLILLGLFLQAASAAVAPPAFVQEKDNQITSGQTNRVTFSSTITAGHLIAVYLIWDSTGSSSVSDSLGNTYISAAGPIRWSNSKYSAQIFYAISRSGGGDTVTATFATAVKAFGIEYAHEYSGVLQTAPVDVTASAVGTSGSLSSGSATTTNAIDLLFAGGVSANTVTSPGAGYTARSKSQGNMTEDKVVSVKGAYSATASNSGGAWAMQMVAFKGAASGTSGTTSPTVPTGLSANVLSSSQITLSWTASTDPSYTSSQITYGVYRNGTLIATTAVGATTWADTGLAPSTTYSYTVSASDPAGNNSAQSSAVQATTLPDTTPPTVPTGLSVTGTTTSTVSLAWTASTDNVGVAGYKLYRGGAQVGTSSVTSYTDTNLNASTTYSYTVSAYDAAGNNSAQTSPVSATTAAQGTQGPTVSITSPASNQTVSGVWAVAANAADNVSVVGVQFKLDGANLGAEVTTSPYYINWNTSQTTNGSHTLTASATDSAGNVTVSSGITVTVSNSSTGSGTYSTKFPLTENPISENGKWINGQTVGLDWNNVQTTPGFAGGVGPSSVEYSDPTAILAGSWGPDQTLTGTVYSVGASDNYYQEIELRLRTSVSPHSITGYEVMFRTPNNSSAYVNMARWNGALGDFTWLNGASGIGVNNGDVITATIVGSTISAYINGNLIVTSTDSTFTSGSPGIGFNYGCSNTYSNFGLTSFSATDQGSGIIDTTPPSTPANLSATAVSASQINLSWTASTDNVAVAGYQVFRDNIQIATTTSPNFSDTAVVPNTQYVYAIAAFDAAGNVSAQSSPLVAATSSTPDTTPPSVPTGLTSSSVTSTTLTVSWAASTDNVAVAGYQVFRNGTEVGTTTTASYADKGLTPSTTYIYTVAAYDYSNNISAQSQQLSVTTAAAALTPPSLVQVNNSSQISSGASVSATFGSPTVAGNTIVVYAIWSNADSVALTDSRGDTFVNVGNPVSWGSGYSAEVFYATNIAGGTDTVTAAFHTSVTSFGVIYVHEYAGISATNPVDVTASASGSSASLNSGSATTSGVNELIFGAGVSDNMVTAPGSGFTSLDQAYGNITEDLIASSIGSYAATATHNGNAWAMQMVAFRAAH